MLGSIGWQLVINIPEEQRPQLHTDENLKCHTTCPFLETETIQKVICDIPTAEDHDGCDDDDDDDDNAAAAADDDDIDDDDDDDDDDGEEEGGGGDDAMQL